MQVFVPSWNNEETIARCLASIRKAIPDAEIILLDRFSTDDTRGIAESFDARIVQRDLNIGETRSLMGKLAEGEWFIMVDSDVYLASDWYETISRFKEQIDGDMLAAVQGEAVPTLEPHRSFVLKQRRNQTYPYKIKRRLNTNNLLIKKSAIADFRTNASVYEDYLLGKHLAAQGYSCYVVPAFADHDESHTMKHARWSGAGMRKYARVRFHKMFGAMLYNPLLKYPFGFKTFGFRLHWNWLIGWIRYKQYLEMKG